MKDYEDMTRSVLEKVKARKAVRKRRNRGTVFVVCSLCCMLLTVGINQQLNNLNEPSVREETNPIVESTDTPSSADKNSRDMPRIMLLTAMPGGESEMQMPFNLEVPYKAEIRVRDISGLTEAELQQISLEERAYFQQIAGESVLGYNYSPYKGKNVFITSMSLGCFGVRFEDINKVDRIRVAVTDNGRLHVLPKIEGCSNSAYGTVSIIDIDGENLRKVVSDDKKSGLKMYWHISMDMAGRIDATPDMDIACISDTITITVNYADGREEIAMVYVNVDSNGKVSAILDEPIIIQRPGTVR